MIPQRIPQLTFTRFIAATTVVVFHWSLHTDGLAVAIRPWGATLASTMVSYFFVLSGFIMAWVYVRTEQGLRPLAYWGRRVARIYPVYLLGVVWMAALLSAGIGDTRHDAKALLLNVLMLQSWLPAFALSVNAPGWSLSAEASFYAIFPALAVVLVGLRRPSAVLAATAGVWLISQVVFHALLMQINVNHPVVSHEFLYYNPLMHVSSFVVGAGAATALIRWRERVPAPTEPLPTGWPPVVYLVAISLMIAGTWNLGRINSFFEIPFSPTNGLLAPAFAVFISALALDRTRVSEVLGGRALVILGEMSYGIYILHLPLSWSLRAIVPASFEVDHPIALFCIYAILLVLVAYSSLRWFETPLRLALRSALAKQTT